MGNSFAFRLDGGLFVAERSGYANVLEVTLLRFPTHRTQTLDTIDRALGALLQTPDYADLDAASFLTKVLGIEEVPLPPPPGDSSLPTRFRYYSRNALNALAAQIEGNSRRQLVLPNGE